MSFPKVTRLACACALVFSSLSPLHASSLASGDLRRAPDQTSTQTAASRLEEREELTATVTPEAAGVQAANTTTKKRPNLFVRIISAPFRGLARLFGGGKNDKTARVKPKAEKPQATATTVTTVMTSGQANDSRQSVPSPVVASPPVVAAAAAAAVTPVAPAAAPPRASNAADESFDYAPRPFKPYIEGVAGDPLSQGRALLENGYTNEAIAELSIAAVAGPDLVEANNQLGLAYDRLGQHKRAQEFYERARGVAPQNAQVLGNLGHSFYLEDRHGDALALLKTASRLAPADTRIANNLGLVYGRLNKFDDAYKQFKRAGGEFYARTNTAALLVKAGRDRDAIKHYESARKLNPVSSDVLRQLITLYVRTGQREKAEAAQRVLDKAPAKQGASASS